jgi:hypothetical protein
MPAQTTPSYHLNPAVLLRLAGAVLLGQRRSFQADAVQMVRGIDPPPKVSGQGNIPHSGPAVILINHYTSHGFWSPWLALAVSANVPVDVYWTITTAWTFPGWRFRRILRLMSQRLIRAVAEVYDFNLMPPMPPDPTEASARTEAVRRLMRYARANPRGVIAIAPEGANQPGGVLGLQPAGIGRLGLALARRGFVFHPVGIFEEGGCFNLQFGAPFMLEEPVAPDMQSMDVAASKQMMRAIAICLPDRLRGRWV